MSHAADSYSSQAVLEAQDSPNSILDMIGRKRMCIALWRATPLLLRPIAVPYGMLVYRRLLADSDTLQYLRALHCRHTNSSILFRALRPRYRKLQHLLRDYGVNS